MKRLTIILIVAVVALLAVHYFLGMDSLRQRQEHGALTAQITEATQTLAQTPKPPQDLEQKLAAAEANLAAVQTDFPRDLNSTRIINAILKLADACQVRAIPLITEPWSETTVGEGYYAFGLNIAVTGDFSQVSSFVSQLENGEFESLVVESLSITRVAKPAEEGTIPVTASLDLAIYAQLTTPK